MSKTSRVLVTGASGFLATHVIAKAFEAGYAVRGTVRSAAKGQAIQQKYTHMGDKFQFAIVDDLVNGDLSDALKDISAVIHVASPFTVTIEDPKKDLLDPAIEGTLNVLRSARKAGITRIVITSSIAAALDVTKGGAWRDYTYTPADWNPLTYAQASSGTLPAIAVYAASKKLAEEAAFDYAKRHPEVHITTINPVVVIGPPLQSVSSPEHLNTSSQLIYQLISGQMKTILPQAEGVPVFVDVRDVAEAHILALNNDALIGKRVLLSAGEFLFYKTVQMIAKERPELASRLPSLEGVVNPEHEPICKVDTSIAEKELGISFMSYEKSLFDTIDSLLEMEKREWKL
ncbi:hypothetical protein B0H19DRAFT_1117104 [Mycena capillaripes]|nr:hypothetical protein B0H19DRAFT_1117091 [Mycena capillaripes]KAJ6581951.1 hypothetical protein B0H19DRAFT_1117104 [Mycena capillaripes]